MSKTNVLITLHRGYGLGDAVQMSAVLRHVREYRPNWNIDFAAQPGQFCIGNKIVDNCFALGSEYPRSYDAEVQILLYDMWPNFYDRPNTRVVTALQQWFDIRWDRKFARYEINVPIDTYYMVRKAMGEFTANQHKPGAPPVAVHYQGVSSGPRKNLTEHQADQICRNLAKIGKTPLVIDWRNECLPLTERGYICSTGQPYKQGWGRDAAINCALISQCQGFIGIDSGPGKCASATNTPALIIWVGHHPSPFHDPALNTTHLVPLGYKGLFPENVDPKTIEWFESNYNVLFYDNGDPIPMVKHWIENNIPQTKAI